MTGREVAEVAVQPVVGVLPDRTGVENDHVRVICIASGQSRRARVPGLLEQAGEPFGVVRVHLAPVGADLVGGHVQARVRAVSVP